MPHHRNAALALLLVVVLLTPCLGDEGDKTEPKTAAAIQMQLQQVNMELEQAQAELNRTPGPNWCCCIGASVFGLIIGGVVWYFIDVKPKSDKRQQLQQRIAYLQMERSNLQNMLILLK